MSRWKRRFWCVVVRSVREAIVCEKAGVGGEVE